MAIGDAPKRVTGGLGETSETTSAETMDPKQRTLALALELSKRAQEAASLDELSMILTNDLRILVEFDRALLITHVGAASELAAATNQPALEKKFPLYKLAGGLPESLKGVEKGVLISGKADAIDLATEDLPPAARDELLSYVKRSECSFLLCVPLNHNQTLLGHLLLEFYGNSVPNQVQVLTVLSVAPLLAAALAEKWLLREKPDIWQQVFPTSQPGRRSRLLSQRTGWAVAVALVLLGAILAMPMNYTVGGEAEVALHEKHIAFVKIDGLVERIDVAEGSTVEKDQVVAVLDRRELDQETKSARRRLEILTREMTLLKLEGGQQPSKLAESELVQLKAAGVREELEYLRWKAGFLDIKAPVSGVVVTREVDSLVGKRFKAGEPFCEIAAPGELRADVYVPEDKISYVRTGQPVEVYLNSEPGKALPSKVAEIAPMAQVFPRLGNVYRVAATFSGTTEEVKVGMKGIGKIETERTSLYQILKQRFLTRWNQYSIYF
ncbi:MAG: efflux RND transporter periplasmic adaptor subunit [Desulfomonile tiedjei]|nr:efflux RND transporter periplasmic adaptor subunit [Desulfomonile tiedjei]